MYIGRKSNHIEADVTRNWSSWNFGQDGFKGSYEQLQSAKQEALESGSCFMISGFQLYGDDIKNADIRELYPNYWVLVDNVNGRTRKGIFGTELSADTLEDAIAESERAFYCGEGIRFDATDAELVYSNDDIHIFFIEVFH